MIASEYGHSIKKWYYCIVIYLEWILWFFSFGKHAYTLDITTRLILVSQVFYRMCRFNSSPLENMAAISQTVHSDASSWMKSLTFWLKCHWNLFRRFQLTTQHCFRIGDKPLYEPVLTRLSDPYKRHLGRWVNSNYFTMQLILNNHPAMKKSAEPKWATFCRRHFQMYFIE